MAFAASTQNHATTTTSSWSVNSGSPSEGDLVCVVINSNDSGGAPTISGGATWYEVVAPWIPNSDTHYVGFWWKIAGTSEPSTYTCGQNGNTTAAATCCTWTSATDAEVSSAGNNDHASATSNGDMNMEAANGQTVVADCLHVIIGAKDNRTGNSEAYTQVTTPASGWSVGQGNSQRQATVMAYRIEGSSPTSPFSGNVIAETADGDDGASDTTASTHVTFVESVAGGLSIPVAMNSYRQRHQLSIG